MSKNRTLLRFFKWTGVGLSCVIAALLLFSVLFHSHLFWGRLEFTLYLGRVDLHLVDRPLPFQYGLIRSSELAPVYWRPHVSKVAAYGGPTTFVQGKPVPGKMLWAAKGVALPLWIPLFVAVLGTVVLFRRARETPAGHCQHCGYNLTGNVSGICPECGTPVKCPEGQDPESLNHRSRVIRYLLVESFFAAGAALSFLTAYAFWVEVQTRFGNPSSMMPLYAPAAGCIAFLYGLITLLGQNRQQPPFTRGVVWCLLIGLGATAAGVLCPPLWR